MKIAIVCFGLYVGGSEQHAIQLHKAIRKYTKNKIRFLILTPSGRPKKGFVKVPGAEYFPMSPRSKKFDETIKAIAWADVVQLSDMGYYDVDHPWAKKYGMSVMPPYFEILDCAGKLNKKQKVVGTWHSSPEYLIGKVFPYAEALADCCDAVYTIRQNLADRLGITYLPHMIEPLPKDKFDYILHNKRKRIVSTSRCISVKGQMYILRAGKDIPSKVAIHGMGNTRYTWQLKEEYKKLKKPKNVTLYGEFKPEELENILRPAKGMFDLIKLEGDEGGTEYVILEAINYGCIPIVDNQWTIPNLKYETVTRNDPVSIARGAKALLSKNRKSEYIEWARHNYNILRMYYDSKHVVGRYMAFYMALFVRRKAKVVKQLGIEIKRVKTKGGTRKTRMMLPIKEFNQYYRRSKVIMKFYNKSKIRLKYFMIDGQLIVDAWVTGGKSHG